MRSLRTRTTTSAPDRLEVRHHGHHRPTHHQPVVALLLVLLAALVVATAVVLLVRAAGGGVPSAPGVPGGRVPQPVPGPPVVLRL